MRNKTAHASIMITCLVDMFFPNVGAKMVHLLRRHGVKVDFPETQICCGQPAFNCGYRDEAAAVGVGLLEAFAHSEYVVVPSGSCAAMMTRHLPQLLQADPARYRQARELAGRTYEFSQFMVKVLGVDDIGADLPTRVTYHPGCHATRELGVRDEPLTLLKAVHGLELIDLPGAEDCCGFGGLFAVKMAEVSAAMGQSKVENILRTGARIVTGTDMGCLMHIGGVISRAGHQVRVMHLIELLAEAAGI